jgi:hypothetical protein
MSFENHYNDWRESRINGLLKYIDLSFFSGKSLLELGCGYADIGNTFSGYGCDVTVCDARQEHLSVIETKYPHLKQFKLDADNDLITDNYDIILHWGLLYHLSNVEQSLKNCCEHSQYLLLETEVYDSDENKIMYIDENGYDQAFNFKGSRPSPTHVEKILTESGFKFKMIKDSILNSSFHTYDWDIMNTNTYRNGLRRYWICWKDHCPLKPEYVD